MQLFLWELRIHFKVKLDLGQLGVRTNTLKLMLQQASNLIPYKIQTSIRSENREKTHHRYYVHLCPLCISKTQTRLLVTPWLTV